MRRTLSSEKNFSRTDLVKSAPKKNGALYLTIKNKILGKSYVLSLVFASPRLSKKLNYKYRQKDEPADILSFALGKKEGEIFIAPSKAKQEAKKFKRTAENFLFYLYIHGLCHLKGMRHGSRMDSEEKKYHRFFNI
jgi:probable rRNA maturation factor